ATVSNIFSKFHRGNRTDRPHAQVHVDHMDPASAERAACCIVGGGPAGAVLARQGIAVTLLEAYCDLARDFRGDGRQPAALGLLRQMGLAERVLALALAYPTPPVRAGAESVAFQALRRLRTPYPFIAVVPQVRLLGLVVEEALRCRSFRLVLGARAEVLLYNGDGSSGGPIRGVRHRARDGWHELRAPLVVAAVGRQSRLRGLAGLEAVRAASPVDILWFRLPRQDADPAAEVYVGDGG